MYYRLCTKGAVKHFQVLLARLWCKSCVRCTRYSVAAVLGEKYCDSDTCCIQQNALQQDTYHMDHRLVAQPERKEGEGVCSVRGSVIFPKTPLVSGVRPLSGTAVGVLETGYCCTTVPSSTKAYTAVLPCSQNRIYCIPGDNVKTRPASGGGVSSLANTMGPCE